MKGIILAGGSATRLYPITKVVSKQLLPVFDKPMIYYPLSALLLAGIRDILIISTRRDLQSYKDLLGDGVQLGVHIEYIPQNEPRGLADAFIVGERFIGDDRVCLILGDNIFYGQDLTDIMIRACNNDNAIIFGYYVKDPTQYGVVEFDKQRVVTIKEKPNNPKSNYAVTGLYFYNSDVVEIAKTLKPSKRGELEITDLNLEYLKKGKLKVELLSRGIAWLDAGSPEGLLEAANFVASVQKRQGLYISCIEEIAYRRGFIDSATLLTLANTMNTEYGEYLKTVALE